MEPVTPDSDDGTERSVSIYDNGIANGDPVVVVLHYDDARRPESVTLGTGWHSMDELMTDLTRALDGESTSIHVPPETADRISYATELNVFTLGAQISED